MNEVATEWRPFELSREAVEEAAKRQAREAEERERIRELALRNGMPPSGRWA